MSKRLVIAVMLASVLALAGYVVLSGRGHPATRQYIPAHFTKLLMGKTRQEVVAALGPPQAVSAASDGSTEAWRYEAATSRGAATVYFKDGVVAVVYHPS